MYRSREIQEEEVVNRISQTTTQTRCCIRAHEESLTSVRESIFVRQRNRSQREISSSGGSFLLRSIVILDIVMMNRRWKSRREFRLNQRSDGLNEFSIGENRVNLKFFNRLKEDYLMFVKETCSLDINHEAKSLPSPPGMTSLIGSPSGCCASRFFWVTYGAVYV